MSRGAATDWFFVSCDCYGVGCLKLLFPPEGLIEMIGILLSGVMVTGQYDEAPCIISPFQTLIYALKNHR